MSVNRTSLGKRISFYRSKSNLTQEVLAAKVNCSREYIVQIENGTKVPSLSVLVKIANTLSVSADELLLDCLDWGLFDHIKTKSFTGTAVNIENFAYMQDWDLGDIVTTGDSSIGITMNERVTEVEEVYEKGSVTIYPVTGKTKSETLNLEDM